MPIKHSAQKALRQSIKRTEVNRGIKTAIGVAQKKLTKAVGQNKKSEAQALLSDFAQTVDKAAKNNVIKKNTAARIKSRVQKAINKLS